MNLDAKKIGHNHPENYGHDKPFTLFYDESNNPRKLLLNGSGLNIKKHDNYVLGGIVLEPEQNIPDISTLRKLLKVQQNAEEIKFSHVAKGDFEAAINSKKLEIVLSWLLKNKIGIHYTNLNILNWATLDIIESIVAEDSFIQYQPFHRELKNELFSIITSDLSGFLEILKSYDYPNIEDNNVKPFLRSIINFVKVHYPLKRNQFTEELKFLLIKALEIPRLIFLTNEKPHTLIESFHHFFLNRMATFKNATHIFDEEKKIQADLQDVRVIDNQKEISYSFRNSKSTPGIQLSDITMGLVGRYFSFIEKTPFSTLIHKRKNLNKLQIKNLELLRSLIYLSDHSSNALLFQITTLESEAKHYFLMTGKLANGDIT